MAPITSPGLPTGSSQGLVLCASADGGRTFRTRCRSDASNAILRTRTWLLRGTLWLAWKEFDGEKTTVPVMSSRDNGASWFVARCRGRDSDQSDYPVAWRNGKGVFLSWQAQREGYRLIPLEDLPWRNWPLLVAVPITSPRRASSAASEDLSPSFVVAGKLIREAHAGQPTIVHFWGLTCGPCRTEMPDWGKFLHERPDLDLLAINADLVPDEAGAVSATLAQTGLAEPRTGCFRWLRRALALRDRSAMAWRDPSNPAHCP